MKAAAVIVCAALCCAARAQPAAVPASASGTFVQRRTLADVGVTLESSGRFRFERGRFFEWETLEPVRSVFAATPTNWTFSAEGRTVSRSASLNLDSVDGVFAAKELSGVVRNVETEGSPFPSRIRVRFKNGDMHEIAISSGAKAAR